MVSSVWFAHKMVTEKYVSSIKYVEWSVCVCVCVCLSEVCTHNFHKRRITRSRNSVTNNQLVFDLYVCEYNSLYKSLQ